MVGRPEDFGLPTPNHKFFEAHPTQSLELLLRLGSGDVIPKPNISRLDGDTVHFDDGTSGDFDIIIYATGYNITFPFFDEEFISAPDNRIDLYKRMFYPGIDDLIFHGFAQATPTLFPCRIPGSTRRRLRRRQLPPPIGRRHAPRHHRGYGALHRSHAGPAAPHPAARLLPLRAQHAHREIPEGLKRARELGPPTWAGVGNAVDKVAPTTSVEAKA